jgi:hypothetical protein
LRRLDPMACVRRLLAKFGHLIACQDGWRESGLRGWRLGGRSGLIRTTRDQEAQRGGHQGLRPPPLHEHILRQMHRIPFICNCVSGGMLHAVIRRARNFSRCCNLTLQRGSRNCIFVHVECAPFDTSPTGWLTNL